MSNDYVDFMKGLVEKIGQEAETERTKRTCSDIIKIYTNKYEDYDTYIFWKKEERNYYEEYKNKPFEQYGNSLKCVIPIEPTPIIQENVFNYIKGLNKEDDKLPSN